jgi:hypothetical protein
MGEKVMKTDRVGRWVSIAANLAVLASIVFLALEIRQNTEMTRAQITLGRSQNNLAIGEMQVNSDYLPDIMMKVARDEELTWTESYRYNAHLRVLLRIYDNDFQQYSQGLLGEHIARNIPRLIERFILGNPHGRDFWERNRTSFSDEFAEFVDSVLADGAGNNADTADAPDDDENSGRLGQEPPGSLSIARPGD